MRNKITLLLLVAILLSACGISEADVQATIAALPTPTEIPTPTPAPLTREALEAVLVLPGDLPAGYTPSQIRNVPPAGYQTVADEAKLFTSRIWEKAGAEAGGIIVMVFEKPSAAEGAYNDFLLELDLDTAGSTSEDIGDKAIIGLYSDWVAFIRGEDSTGTALVFTRCNAAVQVIFGRDYDQDSMRAYAYRLDQRLASLVCAQ